MKRRFFCIIIFSSLLVSCGRSGNFNDLNTFLKNLDQASPDSKKVVLSQLTLPVPVIYQKEGSRTPFDEGTQKQGVAKSNNVNEPLRNYQLNLLRFVGTVTKNGQTRGFVMVPDNKVYEVKKGDTIGDHNGKIINITSSKLEVVEQTGEEGQPSTERLVTLQLKDETTQWTE